MGAVLWSTAVVWLGYILAESWQAAERWIARLDTVLAALLILVQFRLWRHGRRREA